MVTHELNRDVKRLKKRFKELNYNETNSEIYFAIIENEIKKEFIRLYNADEKFEYLNKANVLFMFRLNQRLRFIPFHLFGINIDL